MKTPFWSLFLIKLQPCDIMKKRLQHRCFPVNIAKFLRTAFYRTLPVATVEPSKMGFLNLPLN